jgi:hypothetical protein
MRPRTQRLGSWLLLSFGACAASAACRPRDNAAPAPPPDAGKPRGELTARLVAVIESREIFATHLVGADDGVVLHTPLFQYVMESTGALRRVGDAKAYATLLPPNDEDVTGYDVEPSYKIDGAGGKVAALELVRGDGEAFVWNADAWQPRFGSARFTTRAPSGASLQQLPEPLARRLPGGFSVTEHLPLPNGATLALGRRDGAADSVLLPPGESVGASFPLVRGSDSMCSFLPSLAGRFVRCTIRDGQGPEIYGFAGDRWNKLPLSSEDALRVRAVGEDGALWLGDEGSHVERRTKSGSMDRYDLPTPARAERRPFIHTDWMFTASHLGRSDFRRWAALDLHFPEETTRITSVETILPLAGDRAWVLAHTDRGLALYAIGPRLATPAPPLAIGSFEDQRNDVRATREAKRWVGHCPQLFVALGYGDAAGKTWERHGEAESSFRGLLGKETHVGAAMVEGTLTIDGERRVSGVALWRQMPEATEASFERIASALAARLGSGAEPAIFCTLPALTRAEPL